MIFLSTRGSVKVYSISEFPGISLLWFRTPINIELAGTIYIYRVMLQIYFLSYFLLFLSYLFINISFIQDKLVCYIFVGDHSENSATAEENEREEGDSGGNCGVCREMNTDHFLVPCGHPICRRCGDIILSGNITEKRCPFCRVVPTMLLRPIANMI